MRSFPPSPIQQARWHRAAHVQRHAPRGPHKFQHQRPYIRLRTAGNNTDMSLQDEAALDDAWNTLKEYTLKEFRGRASSILNSADARQALREALILVATSLLPSIGWTPSSEGNECDVLIGVLASDVRLGLRSLRDYCTAFGVPYLLPELRITGVTALPEIKTPVYIKYNSGSKSCYVSAYEGKDRGVLIQLGGEQVGHLPLGLLDEAMARPPPKLGQ